jgi:hypothetical protein
MWRWLAAHLPGVALPSRADLRPDAALPRARPGRRALRIYLIKPSQYDADGFVLRFRWGVIPNNTLTVLAGLTQAYAAARPALDVQTILWEELVDGVIAPDTLDSIRVRADVDGVEVLIGLAGVQTGQYPRARDLALQCLQRGLPVVIAGSTSAATRHRATSSPRRA